MGIRSWYQRQTLRESQQQLRIPLTEQVNAPVTTEDWFWGRLWSTGTEEDYFWRRLSDNWTQKDVLPATYLEIHNQVYEAYNANPNTDAKKPPLTLQNLECSLTLNVLFVKFTVSGKWGR